MKYQPPLTSIVLILLIVLTANLGHATDLKQNDVKFVVNQLDGDITQLTSRFRGRHSNIDELTNIVAIFLKNALVGRELNASENDAYAIGLDVFVDYQRVL